MMANFAISDVRHLPSDSVLSNQFPRVTAGPCPTVTAGPCDTVRGSLPLTDTCTIVSWSHIYDTGRINLYCL